MTNYWTIIVKTKPTCFVGEQIESTEVDDVNPARSVVFGLRVVNKADVEHAQPLNALDVDRQTSELVSNERHELHNVVNLQKQSPVADKITVHVNEVTQETQQTVRT